MIYAIAAALVLVLDQAVKFWTTKNIVLGAVGEECKQLISGVIHMTNVHNRGAAFSILENSRWVLVGVSAVFIIGIVVLISQEIIRTRFGKWTAVLVMAGALGNCIDRVLWGYVVDMFELEVSAFNFAFPVFNVADIFITVCGILFCIHVIVHREPEAAQPAAVQAGRRKQTGRDPSAPLPHRQHRSLEEEMRPANPDDPFAEPQPTEETAPVDEVA